MAKKKAVRKTADDLPFEECLVDLEAIVRRLEEGKGSLDDSLDDYGRAVKLLKTCHVKLDSAQKKIEILTGMDADGNPVTKPFVEGADEDEDLAAKEKRRSQRRSSTSGDESEPGLF